MEDFHQLLSRGNTLEAERHLAATASDGDARLALNLSLFLPGRDQGEAEAAEILAQENARHLDQLKHASGGQRAILLYNLGCFALAQDDILTAKLRFAEAAHLRPNHLPSLHNLAHAHELMAEFDEAKTVLQRALQADPASALTRINDALMSIILGEREAGLAMLRELHTADPNNAGVVLHLCRALLDQPKAEDLDEAMALLDSMQAWEQFPQLKLCRAVTCLLAGRYDEAEGIFSEILDSPGEHRIACMGLIKVIAAQERLDELLPHLERYQQMEPSYEVEMAIKTLSGN